MGTGKSNAWGQPGDGPASNPGGSRNTPSNFMLPKPAQAMVLWVTLR